MDNHKDTFFCVKRDKDCNGIRLSIKRRLSARVSCVQRLKILQNMPSLGTSLHPYDLIICAWAGTDACRSTHT